MAELAPPAHPGLRHRLREKLPEILIEAGSVVLALLLALAVNEWHDRQQEEERADAARSAILAELRANQQELEVKRNELKDIIASLNAARDTSKPEVHEMKVNLSLSLLSAAAWHASLATQASRRIDFAWITRIAKVYELQDNLLRIQNAAVDQLASLTPDDTRTAPQIASALLPRFQVLDQLTDGLVHAYADALDAKSP